MANFYVSPLGGQNPLQGLSMLAGGLERREQEKGQEAAIEQQRQQRQAALAALRSGDTESIQQLMVTNPELAQSVTGAMNFKSDLTRANMVDSAKRIIAGEDPATVIRERAAFVESQGGDPTQTLSALNDSPEQILQGARTVVSLFGTADDRAGLPKLEGKEDQSLPSSVRETQWFLRQPESVQKKHLELKRKTDPTMAQRLDEARKKSEIKIAEEAGKTKAKSKAERLQGYIDSGIEAADSLGNIYRSIELLDSVKTGGFEGAQARARQMFGVESADEAELSARLGKAILSQLKPIFGAAFTAAEGERLERIEANIGKSTAGNRRLLNEVKSITERAARRGLSAARSEGDEFTAQEIEQALKSLKSGKPAESEPSEEAVEYQEGAILQNPQTGERIILKNGEWVPYG